MIVTKMFPSGGWEVTDIRQDEFIRRRYFGYTKKEAIAEFRREFPLRKRATP